MDRCILFGGLFLLTIVVVSVRSDQCKADSCPDLKFCTDEGTFFTCTCKNRKTGPNCDQDDPCVPQTTSCPDGLQCYGPCAPNVVCQDASGFPQCSSCVHGYTGENCTDDEDECKLGYDTCGQGSMCLNTVGSYSCVCKEGLVGPNCECQKGSACDQESLTDDSSDGKGGAVIATVTWSLIVSVVVLCQGVARLL